MRELFIICAIINLSIGISTTLSESYWLHLIAVSNHEINKKEFEKQKACMPLNFLPFTKFMNQN
jgi:hypothetical protein